jgi:hypothetical protein
LTTLAGRLRQPNLDVREFFGDLKEGMLDLLSKAVEAGENSENEIDFSVQNAKENLAVLLEYYAKQVKGGEGLKKLLTHPKLRDYAKATLETVGVQR